MQSGRRSRFEMLPHFVWPRASGVGGILNTRWAIGANPDQECSHAQMGYPSCMSGAEKQQTVADSSTRYQPRPSRKRERPGAVIRRNDCREAGSRTVSSVEEPSGTVLGPLAYEPERAGHRKEEPNFHPIPRSSPLSIPPKVPFQTRNLPRTGGLSPSPTRKRRIDPYPRVLATSISLVSSDLPPRVTLRETFH